MGSSLFGQAPEPEAPEPRGKKLLEASAAQGIK